VSTNSNLNTVDGVLGSAGNPGNPFWINLPNPAGSGNCLIVGLSCPYSASRSIQITDDKSNAWVLLGTVNDGRSMSSVYAAFNVAAGTQKLTVTFDTLLYDCQFCVTEFYGIAGSNALDGTSSATTSATSAIASGQIVTTTAGDLVYQYGYDRSSPDTGSSTITGFTPGNGFNLLSANVFLGVFNQFAIQQSAGAIAPSVTLSGSRDAFNTVAIALKSAPHGTVPGPGIRIVHVQHIFYNRAIADQFPCSGNLIYVATAFGLGNAVLNSVTDIRSNTWNETFHSGVGNGVPQCWWTQNAATDLNTFYLTVSGPTPSVPVTFVIYDIAGAAASAYDTQGWQQVNMTPPGNFSLLTLTPSTPNGLVIATMATDLYFITGSAQTLDTVSYGNAWTNNPSGSDIMDNADGYAHYYNPSTNPVTFGWTLTGGASGFEYGTVIAFKAAGQ
jgi:hypothetical protein